MEDFFIAQILGNMKKIKSSLPLHRLTIRLIKRELLRIQKRLLATLESLKKVRQGSKISRFFRHLFEQKRIKAVLGGNLALLVLGASVLSPSVSALSTINQGEPAVLSVGPVEVTTKVAVRAPVDVIQITQGYSSYHTGIDFADEAGTPVHPFMDGQIEAVIFGEFGLGNHIIVAHIGGLKSVYAHLSKILVSAGEKVTTDKIIGLVGATGHATGNHLHFEVLENGHFIDPAKVLPLN